MWEAPREAVTNRLAGYERVVEVGVGRRPDVAEKLADRGVQVTATDIHPQTVSPAVEFVVDDVTDPDPAVYAGADAVYALNCPPFLHRHLGAVAASAGADCLFTTLADEQPDVPTTAESLPGETLYRLSSTERGHVE